MADWVYEFGLFMVVFAIPIGGALAIVAALNRRDRRRLEAAKSGLVRMIWLQPEGESLPDSPHLTIPVDSPAIYCQHCGAAMEDRLARLSGYDTETGLPQYRLVRACPKVRFHSLLGCTWVNPSQRHTVQGPTDTRLVLSIVLTIVAAILIVIAVSHIEGSPPKQVNVRY